MARAPKITVAKAEGRKVWSVYRDGVRLLDYSEKCAAELSADLMRKRYVPISHDECMDRILSGERVIDYGQISARTVAALNAMAKRGELIREHYRWVGGVQWRRPSPLAA